MHLLIGNSIIKTYSYLNIFYIIYTYCCNIPSYIIRQRNAPACRTRQAIQEARHRSPGRNRKTSEKNTFFWGEMFWKPEVDVAWSSQKSWNSCSGELQMFEMKNLLIRKVGGSMLLEAQKKKVKRQAFLGREFWQLDSWRQTNPKAYRARLESGPARSNGRLGEEKEGAPHPLVFWPALLSNRIQCDPMWCFTSMFLMTIIDFSKRSQYNFGS